jgi:uncharacterized membrane protein
MRRINLLAAAAAVSLAAGSFADEPTATLQVVTPRDDGIIATDINERGDVIGFEWVEKKERPGVISQQPFFARGKAMTYLPLLAGYTATFPAAVSDDGLVVGRVSRPATLGRRIPFRNLAFVWDARTGIHSLGTLPDDNASFATGVTRDGRRVSGFSVGENRIRACYWERSGEGWKATALPHADRLGSNVVAISDDGKFFAAVDGVVPCLWTQDAAGAWNREAIGDAGSIVPRAVNNQGTVVGVRFTPDGRTSAVVWTRDEGARVLDLPTGYVRAQADAVNNAGVVVGMIDGPNGSKTGPNAFAYEKGKVRIITQGKLPLTAATAINDRGQVAGVLEQDDEPAPPPGEPGAPPAAKAK